MAEPQLPIFVCDVCRIDWPRAPRYKECPLCTFPCKDRLSTKAPTEAQAQAVIEQHKFEKRIEAEREALFRLDIDVKGIRQVIKFKERLKELPVANRFEIPPEERCPEYEAASNPQPAIPWRPPSHDQS